MSEDAGKTDDLLKRVQAGDQQALAELFGHYCDRLRRMV